MNNIKEMVNNLNQQITESTSNIAPTEQSRRDSGDFIHGVFKSLKLTFPAWKQNFETDQDFTNTKKLWLRTLIDEEITSPEEISRGLKGARNHDSPFFPSIGQFMKWTKEAVIKNRVNEQAYRQYVPKLAAHTQEEYKEMGAKGLDKLKRLRGK